MRRLQIHPDAAISVSGMPSGAYRIWGHHRGCVVLEDSATDTVSLARAIRKMDVALLDIVLATIEPHEFLDNLGFTEEDPDEVDSDDEKV